MNSKIIIILPVIIFCAIIVFSQAKPVVITAKSERDFIPEGIAVDNRNNSIYISSIYRQKIIVVDSVGKTRNFIKSRQSGYLEGVGMKIDYKRNWLWTVSNKKEKNYYTSKLHAFDLKNGILKQQYNINDTIPHFFNDCIITGDTLFITDTHSNIIYQYLIASKQFTIFYRGKETEYPNGITVGPGNKLYVATYSNGLIQLDINTQKAIILTGFKDSLIIKNLDGIVFYKNTLIGIYNGDSAETRNCIIQYVLNEAGDRIVSEAYIDKGNPLFHTPTTASVAGKRLFLISNSYIAEYNNNKETAAGIEAKLSSPVILVYKLGF